MGHMIEDECSMRKLSQIKRYETTSTKITKANQLYEPKRHMSSRAAGHGPWGSRL